VALAAAIDFEFEDWEHPLKEARVVLAVPGEVFSARVYGA
jgi:hypothetical protein